MTSPPLMIHSNCTFQVVDRNFFFLPPVLSNFYSSKKKNNNNHQSVQLLHTNHETPLPLITVFLGRCCCTILSHELMNVCLVLMMFFSADAV